MRASQASTLGAGGRSTGMLNQRKIDGTRPMSPIVGLSPARKLFPASAWSRIAMSGCVFSMEAAMTAGSRLLRLRAYEAEEGRAVSGIEREGSPIHPAVGERTLLGIRRPKPAHAVDRAQIANDRVRLPEHEITVDQHRHQAVRVHRLVLRRLNDAENAAGVEPFIGQSQLLAGEHDLLDVDRIDAAVNREHWRPPLFRQGGGKPARLQGDGIGESG